MSDLAWIIFFIFLIVLFKYGDSIEAKYLKDDLVFEQLINNSEENIRALKADCEKSGDECVMVFDFVPTKTKGE